MASKSGGSSKSSGDSGGRYGGSTTGTTGGGFGGSAESRYGGGSTASSSKSTGSGSYGTAKGSSAASAGYSSKSTSTPSGSYGSQKGSSAASAASKSTPSAPSKSTPSGFGGAGAGRGQSMGGPSLGKSAPTSKSSTPTGAGAGRGQSIGGPSISKTAPTSPGYGWRGVGGGSALAGQTGPSAPSLAGRTRMGSVTTPTGAAPDLSTRTRMGSVTYGGGLTPPGSIAAARAADRASVPNYTRNLPTTGSDVGRYSGESYQTTGAGFNRAVASRYQGTPPGIAEDRATRDLSLSGPGAPTGFTSDIGVRTAINTADLASLAGVQTATDARRAGLGAAFRAAENQSMTDLGSLKASYRTAIKGRETEGQPNPYGTVHPTKTNDPALGAYGVLRSNLKDWTTEVFGKPVDEATFLSSPEIQDAVFDAKIGKMVAKHGSFEDAAKEWYGGLGGVKNPNARPPGGGPSVGEYAADALGRQVNAYNDALAATSENRPGQPGVATAANAPSGQPGTTVAAATPAPPTAVGAPRNVRDDANTYTRTKGLGTEAGIPTPTARPEQAYDPLAFNSNLSFAEFNRMTPAMQGFLSNFAKLQGPVTFNSTYRDPATNKKVGGVLGSEHLLANAADISLAGMTDEQRTQAVVNARAAGAKRIGAYTGNTAIHVDMKAVPPAPGYDVHPMFDRTIKNMDAAPGWFTAGLSQPIPNRATAAGAPAPAAPSPEAAPGTAPGATPAPAAAPTPQQAPVPTPASRVPAGLRVQTPTATNPYKRSWQGEIAVPIGDMAIGTNPVGAVAQLVSLLTTGNTVMGNVWDASHGKYGENQYRPGDTPENTAGATGRGREDYSTPTGTTAERVEEEVDITPTTPAENFIAKYIAPSEPAYKPAAVPDPVYNWVPQQHHPVGKFSWEV